MKKKKAAQAVVPKERPSRTLVPREGTIDFFGVLRFAFCVHTTLECLSASPSPALE
jgi:hypothetical protein